MNEKEFGEALLKWDSRSDLPEIDAKHLVASVLERDRRRVRRLTIVTVILWVLTAIGVPLSAYAYLNVVFPRVNWVIQEVITHKEGFAPEQLLREANTLTVITLKLGVVLVTITADALLFAAACTIWLVFAARRATLREVNANLAQVTEQLRRLRPAGT